MKTCPNGGKVCFTKRKAHFAMRAMSNRKANLKSYECPYCFTWHLTKDLKKR